MTNNTKTIGERFPNCHNPAEFDAAYEAANGKEG